MKQKYCPYCDQKMKISHYCQECRSAQQRIRNHLYAHAALAVVQRQAVAAIIVGAQPPDQPVAVCPLGGCQALDLIQLSSPPSPLHS